MNQGFLNSKGFKINYGCFDKTSRTAFMKWLKSLGVLDVTKLSSTTTGKSSYLALSTKITKSHEIFQTN